MVGDVLATNSKDRQYGVYEYSIVDGSGRIFDQGSTQTLLAGEVNVFQRGLLVLINLEGKREAVKMILW